MRQFEEVLLVSVIVWNEKEALYEYVIFYITKKVSGI